MGCEVCGSSKGTGRYYGAFVCSSCKIFFMRTVTSGSTYLCAHGGQCTVKREAYTKCRACRFSTCIRANMQVKLVGLRMDPVVLNTDGSEEETPGTSEDREDSPDSPKSRAQKALSMRMKRMQDDKSAFVVSYSPKRVGSPESLATSYALGLAFVKGIETNTNGVMSYAEKLFALETFCGYDMGSSLDAHCDMDVSLEVALKDPLRFCGRTATYYNGRKQIAIGDLEVARQVYCRSLLHYIDWISGCPEMYKLNERDKMQLIATQYIPVQFLAAAYNTYKHAHPGFMLSNGYHQVKDPSIDYNNCEHENKQCWHKLRAFSDRMIDIVQEDLVAPMREMKFKVQEYCMLKQILLFTPPEPLSQEGHVVCRTTRNKYEQLLVAVVTEMNPELSVEEVNNRVFKILSFKIIAFNSSVQQRKMMEFVVEKGIAGLSGRLSYDLHGKRYNI